MLKIRADQLETFASLSYAQFVQDLAHELQGFAPPLARVIGSDGCLAVAMLVATTAKRLRFQLRSSVRMVMELSCVLGSRFTEDPQLPWVTELLEYTHDRSETERAQLLHRRALAYLDEVHGPRNRHGVLALRRIATLPEVQRNRASAAHAEGFVRVAAWAFPEKHEFVGEDTLRALYRHAEAQSAAFELGRSGTLLLAALAFALGFGITQDPCYPWITRTLEGPGFGSGSRRAIRLYRRTAIYGQRVLAHLAPSTHAQV